MRWGGRCVDYLRKGCRTEVVVKSWSLSLENTQKASWNSVSVCVCACVCMRVCGMNPLHYSIRLDPLTLSVQSTWLQNPITLLQVSLYVWRSKTLSLHT